MKDKLTDILINILSCWVILVILRCNAIVSMGMRDGVLYILSLLFVSVLCAIIAELIICIVNFIKYTIKSIRHNK